MRTSLRASLTVLATMALLTAADTALGDDDLPIPPPQLIAPWSTAHVTSRRPVFRWEPAPPFPGSGANYGVSIV